MSFRSKSSRHFLLCQLVFVSRALMQNPKALLLDEPTIHLDLRNRVKVLSAVKKVAAEKKLTVLMTLHEPNDAIMFSDKIALMKEGRIIEYGHSNAVVNEYNLRRMYEMPFNVLKQDGARVVVIKAELIIYKEALC